MEGNLFCCSQCELLLGPEYVTPEGAVVNAREIAEATLEAFGGIMCYDCAIEMEESMESEFKETDEDFRFEVIIR